MKRALLICAVLAFAAIAAHAVTGDITAVRVHGGVTGTCTAGGAACNGWAAEIDISGLATGGSYSLFTGSAPFYSSQAKGSITCTSPTYDTTPTAGTASRTVYLTHELRKPSPNQATHDETAGATMTIRVALSDYIYSVDASCTATIAAGIYTASAVSNNAVSSLAVTNNSTMTYAKAPPICRWVKPGYEQITGDFVVEATCFSKWAKNGKPLAAVVFSVSDAHAHTVSVVTNDMTVSSWGGDQNAVLVYAATISVSTLTQGDVLTANFIAYPWFGNSTSITDSSAGTAPPSENLGPLKLLNDKSATYGAAYCAVKTTGNNSTCAANASQSTAEAATGCLDIGTAITKITAFNNTNYARNNPGGGTVLVCAGSFSYPGTQPGVDQGAQDTYVTITKCSTATQANAIINNGTNADIETQKVKVTGITIDTHVASPVATLTGRNATDVLWLDSTVLNMTDTAPIWQWKLAYATRNSITQLNNGFQAFSTTPNPWGLVRGNSASSSAAGPGIPAHMYASVGNKNIIVGSAGNGFIEPGDISTQQPTDGSIYAFNSAYNINAAMLDILKSGTTWAKGTAIVQNVVEKVTGTDQLAVIAGDGTTATPVDNVIAWHNTFVGERTNLAYNETGTTALFRGNWSVHGNLLFNWNIKTDTFGTANGARVGNWSQVYRVGDAGDDIQSQFGGVFFAPEFDGMYTLNQSVTIGFVNDKSFATGTAAGNGDYHLTSSSSFKSRIAAGEAVLPFDITGAPRSNSGTGAIGAYEFGSTCQVRALLGVGC